MTSSTGRPWRPVRRGSRWHLLYFVLAAFDILTVTGSLYLSQWVMRIYVESVATNEEWAARLKRYSELGRLAAAVNAPGNDIFDTLDADAEAARRDRALSIYDEQLRAARSDLLADAREHETRPLLERLDRVEQAMDAMLAEADLIFRHFRAGATGRAAQRMATMDRTYARLIGELAGLARNVAEIQNRQFVAQIAVAEHLQKFEYLFGCLIVLMVGGVTLYGHKIIRKARADEQELERYAVSLAQARDEAAAASKAKSDFLAVMSHEIRTPLTAVLGMAELMALLNLPKRARSYAQAIGSSGRHLLSIVNNLLDLSRIEAGALVIEPVDFRLQRVLEQVRSLMAPYAAEHGLELTIETDMQQPEAVRGDPTRITQVLLNLVGNAIKFTREGGVEVWITGRQLADGWTCLRFEVRDSGIGIPLDRQDALFVPFSQVRTSATPVHTGTGLGLAISKHLVEAMGGTIGVESAPGRGSLFWFEITLERGNAGALVEPVRPVALPRSPLRVLIVEDVQVNRQLLGEMLSGHGYTTAFAAHGAEAVTLVARERFDVVLMDIQMPVMDGLEATRRIRSMEPPACGVPVLGLTADAMEEARRRYLAAGMDRCLSKPVDWNQLFAAIAEVTAGRAPAASALARQQESSSVVPAQGAAAAGLTAHWSASDLRLGAVEDAEQTCHRLREMSASSPDLAAELHSLKGTAGLFGLLDVKAATEELQAAARNGRDLSAAVDRLAAAVAAARAELVGGEPIPEPGPVEATAGQRVAST